MGRKDRVRGEERDRKRGYLKDMGHLAKNLRRCPVVCTAVSRI